MFDAKEITSSREPFLKVFRPKVGQELLLDGEAYVFQEHPAAPGYAFGQEGKAATVYHLKAAQSKKQLALKVFKTHYRAPNLVSLARRTQQWSTLRGLSVCHRNVITPAQHEDLLQKEGDLIYAVFMPWVEGPSWMEVLAEKRTLTLGETQTLARALAEVLTSLEENGLAHCDLSAANVLLPELLTRGHGVELVDLEQLFASGLDRPEPFTAGTPGYAPAFAEADFWSKSSDRFSGAILLGEILCWSDPRVVQLAGLESYFDPAELGLDHEKYRLLLSVLRDLWGEQTARLLERAWNSRTFADCPMFGDWLLAIPRSGEVRPAAPSVASGPVSAPNALQAQLQAASHLESEGHLGQALSSYKRIQKSAGPGTALYNELELVIQELTRFEKENTTSSKPKLEVAQQLALLGFDNASKIVCLKILERYPESHPERTGAEQLLVELKTKPGPTMADGGPATLLTSLLWQRRAVIGGILGIASLTIVPLLTLAIMGLTSNPSTHSDLFFLIFNMAYYTSIILIATSWPISIITMPEKHSRALFLAYCLALVLGWQFPILVPLTVWFSIARQLIVQVKISGLRNTGACAVALLLAALSLWPLDRYYALIALSPFLCHQLWYINASLMVARLPLPARGLDK